MIVSTVGLGGATVFWTLDEWSSLDKIKNGLLDLGLAKYVPEPRTPPAALKDALGEVYKLSTQLIRPLSAKDGFTVVEEGRGSDTNSYTTLLTAKIDKELRITIEPYDSYVAGDLASRFNKHRGLLCAANVATSLVCLLDSLGATRLRPKGSIYWLPDHKLGEWQTIVDVFETAGTGRGNKVYLLRNPMDADAIRAVRDAIVAEVSAEAARIERDVQSGELGERALENRKDEAEALRRKIGVYEDILGFGLTSLTEIVDKADGAACVAALTLSVANGLVEVA
jgi:hypothetical protein